MIYSYFRKWALHTYIVIYITYWSYRNKGCTLLSMQYIICFRVPGNTRIQELFHLPTSRSNFAENTIIIRMVSSTNTNQSFFVSRPNFTYLVNILKVFCYTYLVFSWITIFKSKMALIYIYKKILHLHIHETNKNIRCQEIFMSAKLFFHCLLFKRLNIEDRDESYPYLFML